MTPVGRYEGFLARADRLGRAVETTALASVLCAMILLGAAQILLRNLLGTGFPWADETLRLLVLWVAMLGAVAASRENRHIRIDVITRFLPRHPQLVIGIFLDLLTAVISAMIAWYSWLFVREAYEFGDEVLNGLPAWPFQAILPVAFALVAYRYLVWSLRRLQALLRGVEP